MTARTIAGIGLALAALSCGSDAAPPAGTEATPGWPAGQTATSLLMATPPRTSQDANVYTLVGADVEIAYAPSVDPGRSVVTYLDHQGWQTFRGSEIEEVATPAGTLVSVVVRRAVDTGSTTFSVLIPRARADTRAGTPVATQGIRTIHVTGRPFAVGQLDEYVFTPLAGTARHVEEIVPRGAHDQLPLPSSLVGL